MGVKTSLCDRIRKKSRFSTPLTKIRDPSFFKRCDREGYELEFEIEEKGYAQFICKIHLPVDAPPGFNTLAQATVKGIYHFYFEKVREEG